MQLQEPITPGSEDERKEKQQTTKMMRSGKKAEADFRWEMTMRYTVISDRGTRGGNGEDT